MNHRLLIPLVLFALLAPLGCGAGPHSDDSTREGDIFDDDEDGRGSSADGESDADESTSVETDTEDPTEVPVEDPVEDPIEDPGDDPVVDPVVPSMDCSTCEVCGDYAESCAATCDALKSTLEPEYAEDWWSCVSEDPCQPDRLWTCFDGLGCMNESVVASHCDALARCSTDGRGWLDEAACREDPYHEPMQWSCLAAERREGVKACLSGMVCDDMRACIDNAACDGDPACREIMSTRLVVDCQRMCRENVYSCGSADARTCLRHCDEAAYRLDDAHRRSVEQCAFLLPDDCTGETPSVVAHCVAELDCGANTLPLEDYTERCGAPADPIFDRSNDWACLGQVLRTAISECLTEAACGDVPSCLEEATCGGVEGCLDFMALRP